MPRLRVRVPAPSPARAPHPSRADPSTRRVVPPVPRDLRHRRRPGKLSGRTERLVGSLVVYFVCRFPVAVYGGINNLRRVPANQHRMIDSRISVINGHFRSDDRCHPFGGPIALPPARETDSA
jgi:hypothetical protein